MAGGKGKSIGGKATGAKDSSNKTQKSHSAKAGLQVSLPPTSASHFQPSSYIIASLSSTNSCVAPRVPSQINWVKRSLLRACYFSIKAMRKTH